MVFGIRPWAAIGLLLCAFATQAQVNVTTYHYDTFESGQNTAETILTPTNVNSTQFGKLFSSIVDGKVYAQPLYLSNVSIGGGTRNVVYVATEHDSVYAIDADFGVVYWQVSLIPAAGSSVNSSTDLGCGDLTPEIGITGTPVIDPGSNTLYVVASSKLKGNFYQYLHALDVTTGAEKFGGPTRIQASVAGTAIDGNGSTVPFNPLSQNQRAGLLLDNGHVIIGWGSHCDNSPWHGWIMSYGAGTLAQEAVFNVSPNGNFGGVWMSGGGLAADSNGSIYFATGNGTWNGTTDFGDSIVKLGLPSGGAFPVLDYFTPWNQNYLALGDIDVASGGVLLLPNLASGRQLLAQMSKTGLIYLVDRTSMGHTCAPACTNADTQIVEEIPNATLGIWGAPAYWNGSIYWGGGSDTTGAPDSMKAFSVNLNATTNTVISPTPTSKTAKTFYFSAPVPSVSANGTSSGIVWGMDDSAWAYTCSNGTNCQVLYAYDATNLANMLYNSSQAAGNRDVPGGAVKFATPIVANGKVYTGGQYEMSVFGLLGTTGAAATPGFNPPPGTYPAGQTLMLTDATTNAAISYTVNGTTPGTGSSVYSAPIVLNATTTVNAVANARGYAQSALASGTYTITGGTGTTPTAASLAAAANVNAVDSNGSPVPNGGIDGVGDAYSANLLGSSLTWSGAAFTIAGPGAAGAVSNATVALPAGNYSTLLLLATGVQGNQPNQSFVVNYTDGSSATFTQSLSDWFTPQGYPGETVALTTPYRLTATGALDNRTFNLYGYSLTLNAAKTVQSIKLPPNRDVVVLAMDLTPAAVVTLPNAPAPGFTPVPGAYAPGQTVTLTDGATGAVINYTLDGSTPTATSPTYSKPIVLNATTTVNAIANATGYAQSPMASGTFTISSPPTTPAAVSLAAAANVNAVDSNGSPVPNGGIDGGGFAYSANLLGNSLTWSGAAFTLAGPGSAGAVSNATVALPAGNYSTLLLLATGVQGNQPNQNFVVTYTDGSSTTFTQSLSDWFTPQGYAGETVALAMPYRLTATGALDNRTFNLYGYSLALNAAKTVQSIKLPPNRDVVVLAMDLTPAAVVTLPNAPAPGFTPVPGAYAPGQTVTLTDGATGAVINYTLDGSTPTATSPTYSKPIVLNASTTVNAIANATGYAQSPVASGTFTISSPPPTTPAAVSLAAAANVNAVDSNGSPVPNGGIDGAGFAYSASLLGSSLTWSGAAFTIAGPGAAGAVSNATVALPAGNYSTLLLLATGVQGNQPNQNFVVTYTDGSSTTFTQSLSDWFTPQGYPGETVALAMPYRLTATGALDNRTFNLYGYSLALNAAKTVQSIKLPPNRDVVVLAINLTNKALPVTASLAAAANVNAVDSNGSPVPNGGIDGAGFAYSANLLGSSLTWSGATFTIAGPGGAGAVSNATVTLPAGNYSTLLLLATGVQGNQPNQNFVVTYTDGGSTTFTQSLSDWFTPQGYTGETVALAMPYRLTATGAEDIRTFNLYGYAFALNNTRTVQSIKLPGNRDVVVLGVTLVP